VVVSDPIAAPSTEGMSSPTNKVEIVKYSPQRIELRAEAPTPAVLLLNDRYDNNWQVTIDGAAVKLLRCNFIMRGVQIPAGQHTVLFQFRPSLKGLKISLAAIGIGVILCVMFFVIRQTSAESVSQPLRETKQPGPAPNNR
jgi:uncharacterized membrane protein YfhO